MIIPTMPRAANRTIGPGRQGSFDMNEDTKTSTLRNEANDLVSDYLPFAIARNTSSDLIERLSNEKGVGESDAVQQGDASRPETKRRVHEIASAGGGR